MPEAQTSPYLSIGDVLGILLEEFPDVTISKIRFLESQGLISPERTASGYRKFYESDVDLLRVILSEQRENYLPLRVIKDRLDSGEIDPTGEHSRPRGIPRPDIDPDASGPMPRPEDVPMSSLDTHPAAGNSERPPARPPLSPPRPRQEAAPAQLLPGVHLDRNEFCAMTGLRENELDSLEEFGIIRPIRGSGRPTYGDLQVRVGVAARDMIAAGCEVRHLRAWRTSAEREISLFEQLAGPRLRHRDPGVRAESVRRAAELAGLGAALRSALVDEGIDALGHH
jgi:DNA-binding transcriptional MerR regulator